MVSETVVMDGNAVLLWMGLLFLMRVGGLAAVPVLVGLCVEVRVSGTLVRRALVGVLVGVPEPVFVSVTHRLGGLVSPSNDGGNSPTRALSIIRR